MRYAMQFRTKEMLKRIPRGDLATNMFRTTLVAVVHAGRLGFEDGVAEATRVMREVLGYHDFAPHVLPVGQNPDASDPR